MSETTLHAIVLRRQDAGEADRRMTVLSRELGKVDIVARGARKAASRLAGSSDPLSVAEFSIALGKRNRFVTQAQPIRAFSGLRNSYERLTLALALCELYTAILPWEEPQPEAYDLLEASLKHLEVHPKPAVAMSWAEVRLLELSGFLPQFDCCVASGRPVAEAQPFLSPSAGGYVSEREATPFLDRFRSRAEVLYGLGKLHLLNEPPPNFKFVEEALADLLPFWQHVTEMALPANVAIVAELRHGS